MQIQFVLEILKKPAPQLQMVQNACIIMYHTIIVLVNTCRCYSKLWHGKWINQHIYWVWIFTTS